MRHMPIIPRLASPRGAATALVLAALLIGPSTALGADEFPAGFSGYHTYAEVASAAKAVETAHPAIAKRFSLGKSYQGREIWAMKISDNVGTDEAEPEILYEGGHHADEHMGVELALRVMRWLTDGYGTTTRIRNIVNTREIWIIFLANPDGAEHDISGGKFHHWRKNRQPTPGTPYTGTDLNRNYGYRWGGGGRTSSNPQAITYRGTNAFSTPEARAVRDFLASRVIGGRQQIRVAVSFHESGRLVMWPYGYTYTDIPIDMTRADHLALKAIGKKMAASNGYRPIQASSLYITSGTTRDFLYGMYRIYSYTFELSVTDYPDDSRIASETSRNKEAVLYLAERAWCPLSVLGEQVRLARCGAFDDDLEVFRGWTYDPDGTDTATTGKFSRANPAATSSSGPKQLTDVPSGSRGFVTGGGAGSSANANDLDGRTSVRSPAIRLSTAPGQRLFFRYVLAHGANSTSADRLVASIESSNGTRTPLITLTGKPADVDGVWRSVASSVDAWAGQTIRIHLAAVDAGSNSLVEVEIDDVRITRGS